MNRTDFTVAGVSFAYRRKYLPLHSIQMNNRKANGLTLVVSGTLTVTFSDGTSARADENAILLQRRGDTYHLAAGEDGAEYIVISYTATPEDELLSLLPESRLFLPEHPRRHRDAFERAARVFGSAVPCSAPLLRALVQEILCNIIRESYPKSINAAENPAAFAKNYIEEYFDRNLSANDIAAAAACSPSHLRMLFKTAFHDSPIHYLNAVRVERAKEMLSSGLFRLDEIATACGFQNVYYFSRVFKSFTGVSPGKY